MRKEVCVLIAESGFGVLILFVLAVFLLFLAKKFHFPRIPLFLVAGILLGRLVSVDAGFVSAVAILCLVMIAYDTFSRLKIHSGDSHSNSSLKVAGVVLGLSVLFVSVAVLFLGLTDDPVLALVVGSMLTAVGVPFVQHRSARLRQMVSSEAHIGAGLAIFVCSLMLHFVIFSFENSYTGDIIAYMGTYCLQILMGIGSGLLVGIIVFKIFRKLTGHVSGLALLAIILGSYLLAELLQGAGIFAVMSLALLYGGFTIRHRAELEEFSRIFSDIVQAVLLIVLGAVAGIEFSFELFLYSFLVFCLYLSLRYLAVSYLLREHGLMEKEKWLVTFAPLGIAVACLALSAFVVTVLLHQAVHVVVMCILYSQILSLIVHTSRVNS